MINKDKFLLYAVTDRSWLDNNSPLSEAVYSALLGGVTLLQLREKEMSTDEIVKSALELKPICREFNVPLIINDNIEACIKSGADGVHLGQGDTPLYEARKILGNDKIIGITAKTVEQALSAQRDGADYIGSGAIFGTFTKNDAKKMDMDTLKSITSAVSIPVVAIGGIKQSNILQLKDSGISGAAVVSGIFAQPDICAAVKDLKKKIIDIVQQ